MKKAFVVCLIAVLLVSAVDAKKKKAKSNVVVLTDNDFDEAVKKNKIMLVEFYAPWCGHCKALAPEYEKAAKELKQSQPDVVLAKVDATEEEELAQRFGITGFPTLKFFKEGVAVEYSGGRTAEAIVNWIAKRTGPAAKTFTSKAEIDQFKTDNKVAVVGFFADVTGEEAKAFESAALMNDDIPFAIVTDAAVAKEVEAAAPGIVLFKQFDEGRAAFEGNLKDSEEVSNWVGATSLPSVVHFDETTAPKIFGGAVKSHSLLFADMEAEETKALVEVLSQVAKKFKGKMMFVTVSADEERILEFFGLTSEDAPALRVVQMKENDLDKYKFDGKFTVEEVEAYVNDFFDGKLKKFLKSQPVPETNDAPVKVVVGTTFEQIVKDPTKDVLVELYAPWCGHCKALVPEYEKLAEELKDVASVVIAKMDATANEVDGVEVRGFPTLRFYPANKKGEPIEFDGERKTRAMAEFIKKNAAIPFEKDLSKLAEAADEEEEEEEEEEVPMPEEKPKKEDL